MTLYLLKDRPSASAMLEGASKVIAVLQREFGRYPFGEFAVAEVPREPAERAGFLGVGFVGFFLARSDYLDSAGFDVSYFGHETAHQWWPYVVAQRGGTQDLMMTEALAQYGGLRATEAIEGSMAAERHRRSGLRNGLRLMAAGYDYPLGKLRDDDASYDLSDSKGYLVYDLLSRTLGRERFQRAMRYITHRHAFASVTWEQFRSSIEVSSGRNLSTFFRQWFDRPGAPDLALDWSQHGPELSITVVQRGEPYDLHVPIQVEYADGSATRRVMRTSSARTVLLIAAQAPVYAVRLDPHAELFRANTEFNEEAKATRYWTLGNQHWNHGRTDEALKAFTDGLAHLPEPDAYGAEFLLHTYNGWIKEEAGDLDAARQEYEATLRAPTRSSEKLPILYLNLARVAQRQGDRVRAESAVQGVLAAELAVGQVTGKSCAAKDLLREPKG